MGAPEGARRFDSSPGHQSTTHQRGTGTMIDYDAHLLATYGPEPEGDEPTPPMTAEEEEEVAPRPLEDVLREYMAGLRAQRLEDARVEAEYRAEMDRDYWS
jgi:hypothetical protein